MEIDKALSVAGSNQCTRDKIVKWQEMGDRWGHYSRNTVTGHRNISTSTYAEQNHASIKAMAPDDAKRTVEQNVVDIMRRDKTRTEDNQKLKFLWYTEEADNLSRMIQQRAAHLSEARSQLDRRSYGIFEEQYDHSLQFSTHSEVRDGVAGCVVRHVNSADSDARFIPNGEQCKLCNESKAMTFCRHTIAKCRHNGTPLFDPKSVDPIHFFYPFVPRARLDGSWVKSGEKRLVGRQSMDLSRVDEDVDVGLNTIDDNVAFKSDGTEGVVEPTSAPALDPFPAETSNFADVMTSPSKQLMPTSSVLAEGRSHAAPRTQVSYNTFLSHGKDIGAIVVDQCIRTQHAVSNHLRKLFDMLDKGDYTDPRHAGTCVESLAHVLGTVAKDRSSAEVNEPRRRVVQKAGRSSQYRLGSEKSTISRPRTCGFCKRQGCQSNACSKKNVWGEATKVSKKTTITIAEKLEQISRGQHSDFCDIGNVLDAEAIASKTFLDTLPSKIKHLQVKGYIENQGKRYLFCTCIDGGGETFVRKEGSVTKSYTDLFINSLAVTSSLSKLDNIFWKSSV